MLGLGAPGAWDWPVLRALTIARGRYLLYHVRRAYLPEAAALAARQGLTLRQVDAVTIALEV